VRRILGLSILVLVLGVALTLGTNRFLTRPNLTVILDNMALETIILSGMTLLLIGGYFDLSVDGVVALSGIVAGLAMNRGVPWPMASLAGVGVGLMVGLINGVVVALWKINGLIATLTTWWICLGFAFGLTKAIAPYQFPEAFQVLGQARVLGLRVIVFYALASVVLASVVLHLTKFGAHVYVSGDNREASYMMGVPVQRLGMALYLIVGLLGALCGILLSARLNAASPLATDGTTLRVIAAAVIGGCSLAGGKGSVVGGLLGLLLLNVLGNAIVILGISPHWQKAVLGGVLLTAVLTEQLHLKSWRYYRESLSDLLRPLCARPDPGGLRRSDRNPGSTDRRAAPRSDR
jgi:ribose transport system permease protein